LRLGGARLWVSESWGLPSIGRINTVTSLIVSRDFAKAAEVWKNATEESARRGTLKFLPTEGGSRVRRTLMTDAPRVNEGHIKLWRV
jgi:hypothetical protein